jgi:hypothetical protein
LEKKDRETVT